MAHPYADKTYYRDTYIPQEAISDDTELDRLLLRASEDIDNLTHYTISEEDLSVYNPFIQNQVKKAVCAQVEYINASGEVDVDGLTSGFSLGKLAVNNPVGITTDKKSEAISQRAIKYLKPTGLMYGGGVRGV